LFYPFSLERRIPASHLLRLINPVVTRILIGLGERLAPFCSDIGRPSIDPELTIRMLIVGYCLRHPLGETIAIKFARSRRRAWSISSKRPTMDHTPWCAYRRV